MANFQKAAATAALALLSMSALASIAVADDAATTVTPDSNMARDAIPDAYKWKLDPLFADDAAFEAALTKATDGRAHIASYKGKLLDPAVLRECLDAYFANRLLTNKLTMYASLRFDSYQSSPELQALYDKSLRAMADFMSATGFIRQEILGYTDEAIASAYAAQPQLAVCRPYIDEIRRMRSHALGAEAEDVLSLAGDIFWAEIDLNELPSDFEKAFNALLTDIPLPKITDEEGKEVQLTWSNYPFYRSSKDRRVRKETVERFFATLKQYQHALAATFGGQVGFNIFLARAHGYDTALDAFLDRDNTDPAVYRSLIAAVRANLEPLHRYVRLRKKVMGLDEVHIYDLYPPMVATVEKTVPYDEGRQILVSALSPLGEDYIEAMKAGLDPSAGWVDVYPHKDKQSGAFSASTYGVHPYIKLNHFDDLEGLSTLAHELGHALHSQLSMTHQPYVTFNYAPFNAEIASTINEKLLNDYLVAHAANDDEKLYLLNDLVDRIRTTIYRQTLFAEMELRVHTAAEQGTPITADFLTKTYADLIRTYYGPDFTMGENDDIEWAYVPHFYYKYYMFSYATGLSAGIALAERIENGGDEARKAYLSMLEGGSSKPPLDLLKDAGVDLTRPEAVEAAAKLMDRTLEKMEQLLSQRASR